MNKTVKFQVEIVVSDSITDDNELNEMAQNIATAIVSHANTTGITPENSEAFTEIVYVKEWYSNKPAIEHTDKNFKAIKDYREREATNE